ncbi:MAG: FAD-dependent oxidoreductase [Anaerolineae bacterium]|nr:FAD-dependent oxidoreductase [Anaerolineae bacterium]
MPLPNPLRVAIIGSGPSAFYAAEYLQKHPEIAAEIDMFERLPTPFGLVRGGVAPDHPKIKSVTRVYDRIAAHPSFRFYGNVTMGEDITHDDLIQHYHIIIYAVGAQTDRQMGIRGEDLPGSHAATEFVGWYNGHPDYRDLEFDLSQESAAVIGNGNVAMDVVRILARTQAELRTTDIAQHALEALSQSHIKTIYILGRRGPVQAKFTSPELKELAELEDAYVRLDPEEVELDPLSRRYLLKSDDRTAERNYQLLKQYAQNDVEKKSKGIVIRFLVSPVEITGEDHVEAIKLVKNALYEDDNRGLRPRATGEYETIPVGLVFRSIGYHGVPLPDVPFDDWQGVIPNEQGRIIDKYRQQVVGEYVTGWIKRGPSGIIGTNKPDAHETVQQVLEDTVRGVFLNPPTPSRHAVEDLLNTRGIRYVTYADWQILDRLEIENGKTTGRPRLKFTRVDEMLAALDQYKKEFARVLKM